MMFKRLFVSLATLLAVSVASVSTAHAGVGELMGRADYTEAGTHIIKAHTSRQVHDKLHRRGYYRVHYIDRFYGSNDRPVYKFKACRRGLKYKILVDWYGDIVKRREIGECYPRYRKRYKHDRYNHRHNHKDSYYRSYKD